ncbi:CocE/NonD family hydrolase [Spongiibacter sp. KMU-166]|uniref:CocE/NonD family hydrolase n=1 Tax=Spongiibacter thalassae TaxID=2721624 RepID=A0ABX1GB84_9GAMM|nr:CocE/NonD family hydrolase [Spongiibacter thalassae]NKI16438.1 CocE/NonD family hydrolase [Spongiibacter thalassae]
MNIHQSLSAALAVCTISLTASCGGGSTPTASTPITPAARTYEGMVTEEAYLTTRYGDTMNIDLCFPAEAEDSTEKAAGKFPVIVELSYTTGAGSSDGCDADTGLGVSFREFVRNGYVAGYVNVPGTGESEGGPWNYGDPAWALRNYDAIEWLGAQEWSTGNVGTIGGSGNGVSQVQTAPFAPPSWKAMIPQVTSGNGYMLLYPGGIRSLATASLVCSIPGGLAYSQNGTYTPPQDESQWERMVKIWSDKVYQAQTPYCPAVYGFWDHPQKDEFWDFFGIADRESTDIPAWVWSSWDDLFVAGSVDDYETFGGSNNMMAFGFMSHSGNAPGFDFTAEALRWFDYWLKDVDNGIAADLNDGRFRYMTYQEWVPKQADDWPLPNTEYQTLYLNKGLATTLPLEEQLVEGSLTPTLPEEAGAHPYTYSPVDGLRNGYTGFSQAYNETNPENRNIVGYNDPGDRGDQRLENPLSRVVYMSEPLAEDMEVTGPITMTLYASTTASDTDFVVKLIDVFPDEVAEDPTAEPQPGAWLMIQPGYLKGTFRSYKSDYRRQDAIPAGEIVKYEVALFPASWLIKKGHRIAVAISSSDFPYVFPNENPADITVHYSAEHPSHIVLPVIPAGN